MCIRLVAIDIDGTLKAKNMPITERTKRAVEKAVQSGIHVILSTGRGYAGSRQIVRELMLNDPVITFGGAMIVDPTDGQTIYRHTLFPDTVAHTLRCCKEIGIHAHLYQDDLVICAEEDDFLVRYTAGQGLAYLIDPRICEKSWENVPKVLAMVQPEKEMEMLNRVRDMLEDQAEVSKTEPGYIEINAKGTSKGDSVRILAERYGIQREETAAIGDSFLDMSMMEWAGEGIAVGNALPEVLAIADRILPSCREDGVALYLEELTNPA